MTFLSRASGWVGAFLVVSGGFAAPATAAQSAGADAATDSAQRAQFRPYFGSQLFSAEGPRVGDSRARSSWIGLKAAAEGGLFRRPVGELGLRGHFFRSVAGVDSTEGRMQEYGGEAYVLLKANTLVHGIPMVRLGLGWISNERGGEGLFPRMEGTRLSAEVAVLADEIIGLGLTGGYVFAGPGRSVIEAGGYLSHRVSQVWQVRFAATAAVARLETSPGTLARESWLAFGAGLAAVF